MRMARPTLPLVLLLAACHDHAQGAGAADEYRYDCDNRPAGVTVFATDESFRAFVEAEAGRGFTADDARAARVTAPAPGATLSAANPPQFVLQLPLAVLPPAAGRPVRPPRPSRWQRLLDALAPVGTAWAHCPAVNGANMLFRLQDGAMPVYTAVLSVNSFTPDPARWRKALGGRVGKTLTLTLVRAVLGDGDVREGPFVASTAPTFLVGP